MGGNSFGHSFVISTFGESHGEGIGLLIDGFPAGFPLDLESIQHDLNKRKPGQSVVTTSRKEADEFKVLSGLFEGKTTGAPLAFFIQNTNQRPADYDAIKKLYRPSHADFTYEQKYGWRDHRGGGRSSARETAARVIAGAVAKQYLSTLGVTIHAYTRQIGSIKIEQEYKYLDESQISMNDVKCPDEKKAKEMQALIESCKQDGDSIGGVVGCLIKNCPVGLGEPVYDKLEAELAKAMLSINASKGFEIGSGFQSAEMKGSENNDEIILKEGKEIGFKTNNAGGTLGGISNGDDIFFNVAFKPTSTIAKMNRFISTDREEVEIKSIKGRHDPCIVPRAVAVVEAMAAIVLLDLYLRDKSSNYD
jgi:chorismate synthase